MYDSGRQTRCFTYVGDIVEGTIAAASNDDAVGEVFNLGSTAEWAISDAIAVIIDQAGGDVDMEPFLTAEELGGAYQDIDRRVPDVTKARSLLGWEAQTPLAEGVAQTIQWARAHPSWLSETMASEPSTASSRP